jgi:hypothetical protein
MTLPGAVHAGTSPISVAHGGRSPKGQMAGQEWMAPSLAVLWLARVCWDLGMGGQSPLDCVVQTPN